MSAEEERVVFDATNSPETVVIYHDHCADGMTAAWIVRMALPRATYAPMTYDVEPDLALLTGKDVIIVDFSFKRGMMERICGFAKTVQLYDHHVSAIEDLDEFDSPNLRMVLDQRFCGARIAWNILFMKEARTAPWLIDYVEDRDLWKFDLPHSKEVSAAIASYKLTFDDWDTLHGKGMLAAAMDGKSILRYQQRLVERIAAKAITVRIDGRDVPGVYSPVLQSEIGHVLAEHADFAAVFFDRVDGTRVFSLRSRENGTDVKEIAVRYGGGGHTHAASFTVKPNL